MPNAPVPAAAPGLPLSRLFRDPFLRAAFERAERDDGQAFPVPAAPRSPTPPPPALAGARIKREVAYA